MTNDRIEKAFNNPGSFIGFLTAGDPNKQTTIDCIKALVDAGTDLIEIGLPFSDPCAEGPVIEAADQRALKAGMTTDGVFEIIEELRSDGVETPIVLLSYYNPVFKYNPERFFRKLKQVGGDGIIIPDMPYEESKETKEITRENDLCLISMIAPTSNERIARITKDADGFIYLVSSMGVTGVRKEITSDIKSFVEKIKEVKDIPVAVGFGISTPEQAEKISKEADGVIVGSAIVKLIEEFKENSPQKVYEYASSMKNASSQTN